MEKNSKKKLSAQKNPSPGSFNSPIMPDLSAFEKAKEEYDRTAFDTPKSKPSLPKVAPTEQRPAAKPATPAKPAPVKKAKPSEDEKSDIFKAADPKPKKKKAPDKAKKKKQEADDPRKGVGAATGLIRAIIYIVCVLVISAFLSYTIITVANDVFAFVKSNEEITISVAENENMESVANKLKDLGVIKYPFVFTTYANLRHKADGVEGGEYVVSPSNTYDQLLAIVRNRTGTREQISITIPEGTTVDGVIDLFLEQNIEYSYIDDGGDQVSGTLTREGFVNVIQNFDFEYDFVRNIPVNESRKYRLEGYLYPDTYNFYSSYPSCNEEEAISKIIYRLLANFDSKFTESYRQRAAELGYSIDEIVNFASIIQSEAYYVTDYADVSSVLHNRMNNPSATNGKLESDATVQYALPERVEHLTETELAVDSLYNTRIYPGLPPSAICNPGIDAIEAALYPNATDYYYFYSPEDKTVLFATTYNGHLANIANSGG